jgi:transcriptional regulator with XRE-family HTH domain
LRKLLLDVLEEGSRIRLAAVGERIKQARQDAGLTQDELADLVGVGMRQIQYYEAGESDPYRKIQKISESTNVPVGWLLHGDAPPTELDADQVAVQLEALEAAQERVEELLREVLRRLPDAPDETAVPPRRVAR